MDAALSMAWGEMDDLGGEGLVVPVIHGNYQLVPKDWDGDLAESELVLPDHEPDPQYVTTLAEARELEFWREPTIPEGWVLYHAYADDVWTGPYYGYTAIYLTEVREYPDGVTTREPAFEISGYFALQRKAPWDAIWHNGGHVRETRVIAGRPAVIIYSPSGPNHDWVSHIHIHIYDPCHTDRVPLHWGRRQSSWSTRGWGDRDRAQSVRESERAVTSAPLVGTQVGI